MSRLHVAVGIVTDARGRVLVDQRPTGSLCSGQWEFPGGKIEAGEAPYQTLCRELHEELGIGVLNAEPLIVVSYDYDERQLRLDVWWFLEYRGTPRGREQQPIRWVRLEQIAELDFLPANQPILNALAEQC